MMASAGVRRRSRDPDPERAAREVDRGHLLGEELGAEAGGLLPEAHHELGAHDALGEAGEVLDLGGEHQLAAGLVAGADDGSPSMTSGARLARAV